MHVFYTRCIKVPKEYIKPILDRVFFILPRAEVFMIARTVLELVVRFMSYNLDKKFFEASEASWER